jgi:Tol biopolymer transport system component
VTADIVGQPSWSSDGGRLVYAAEGADGQLGLWVVSAAGGTPAVIPGVAGQSPAWSPAEDLIAYSTAEESGGIVMRFTSSRGEPRLGRLTVATGSVGASAFSWSGRWVAQGLSPGAGDAEIVVVDLERGDKRTLLRLGPFTRVRGVAWSRDDSRLLYGLVQHESRVLLFDGVGRY